MRSFVEVGCDIPLLGPIGSLTSSFIPAGRLVGAGRSAHTSAGASSIVVTAYMVRVSMSCGICTIPI